jgi:hypothetical protein
MDVQAFSALAAPESPSHGENRGSSPLGSATSFAQSFTFKVVGTCLCKKDAAFV